MGALNKQAIRELHPELAHVIEQALDPLIQAGNTITFHGLVAATTDAVISHLLDVVEEESIANWEARRRRPRR